MRNISVMIGMFYVRNNVNTLVRKKVIYLIFKKKKVKLCGKTTTLMDRGYVFKAILFLSLLTTNECHKLPFF